MSAGLLLAVACGTAAATTDLADVPLANATTTVILPNIAFVFDDSGSMNDENMPDSNNTNKGSACWKWHKYNTLAYNPAQTYRAPIKADGSRYANASFTAALKDGYFDVTAKQFDGSTNNGTIDLTTLGTVTTTKAIIAFPELSGSKHYASSLKVTLRDSSTVELLDSTQVPNSTGTSNEDSLGAAVASSVNARADITGFSAAYSSPATD